jgi:hypothetical protein
MPCVASASAASSVRITVVPVAIRVTSSPSRSRTARPGTNSYPGGLTSGTPMRLTRTKTGPSCAAAQRSACAVSAGSLGTTTVSPGIVRSHAWSSIEWCVGPSSP